jgi:hypothetical protein
MGASLTRPTVITLLDAVNYILASIGESPVSSLDDTARKSAVKAQNMLGMVSVSVQSVGYNFCTEPNVTLEPSPNGEIYLPENILAIAVTPYTYPTSVVTRGGRLYDRLNSTYKFAGAVQLSVTLALDWTDLPQPARDHIAAKAGFLVGNSTISGDPSLRITAEEVSRSLVVLEQYDRRLAPGGLLVHNPFINKLRGGY